MQQRLVAARQAHHRLVDCLIAVRVQSHRLADNVRRFRPGSREKPHFVHRIQQLSVRRLKAVNFRNRARDDDRHRVGHVVLLKRLADGLLHHLRPQSLHVRVHALRRIRLFFLRHSSFVPSLFSRTPKPSPGGRWPRAARSDEGWGALLYRTTILMVLKNPHQSRLRRASFPQGKPLDNTAINLRTYILKLLLNLKICKA